LEIGEIETEMDDAVDRKRKREGDDEEVKGLSEYDAVRVDTKREHGASAGAIAPPSSSSSSSSSATSALEATTEEDCMSLATTPMSANELLRVMRGGEDVGVGAVRAPAAAAPNVTMTFNYQNGGGGGGGGGAGAGGGNTRTFIEVESPPSDDNGNDGK